MLHRRELPWCRCGFAALLSTVANLEAQLPPGHVVYAHRSLASPTLTGGGITAFDPAAGHFTAIAPLPPALLHGDPTQAPGVGCVLVRDRDGEVFAAPLSTPPGQPSAIYQLGLDATLRVTRAQTFPLGVALGQGRVLQMDFLGDGRIVYVHSGGAGTGPGVRILDPRGGVDAPTLSMRDPLQPPTAVAASRTGLGYFVGTGGQAGAIHLVDLQAHSITSLATLPRAVRKLAVDHRSAHVCVSLDQYGIYDLDCTRVPAYVRPLCLFVDIEGLCVERVGGRLYVAIATVFGGNYQCLDPVSRAWQPLPGAYPAESPTDIACRSSLLPYGSDAAPTPTCSWCVEGNPGGTPTAGNPDFSISMRGLPGGMPSLLLLSGGSSQPLAIATPEVHNILIDPATFFYAVLPPPPSPNPNPSTSSPPPLTTVPLPIPAMLPPCSIYAQILQLEHGALFGSEGLAIHVH